MGWNYGRRCSVTSYPLEKLTLPSPCQLLDQPDVLSSSAAFIVMGQNTGAWRPPHPRPLSISALPAVKLHPPRDLPRHRGVELPDSQGVQQGRLAPSSLRTVSVPLLFEVDPPLSFFSSEPPLQYPPPRRERRCDATDEAPPGAAKLELAKEGHANRRGTGPGPPRGRYCCYHRRR